MDEGSILVGRYFVISRDLVERALLGPRKRNIGSAATARQLYSKDPDQRTFVSPSYHAVSVAECVSRQR